MKYRKNIIHGLHIEGPFFNLKKRGAHPESLIRSATDREIELIAEKGKGVVKILTAAPEAITEKQIKLLRDAGINVSAGHTDVTFQEGRKAFLCGMNGVTHLYNAISQFNSRNPGLVGAFFDSSDIYGGIITDGVHCDYAAIRIAYKLKKGKLFIVSDSSYVNHPVHQSEFDFGFGKIRNINGQFFMENGSLAGAAVTVIESVRNCILFAGIDPEEAFKMASLYPAEYIGADQYLGKIKEGYIADILLLDKNYGIEKVFSQGKLMPW